MYTLASVAVYPFAILFGMSFAAVFGLIFGILFFVFALVGGILAFVFGLVLLLTSPVWGLLLLAGIFFFQAIMWLGILWMAINVGITYGIASLVALASAADPNYVPPEPEPVDPNSGLTPISGGGGDVVVINQ